MPNTNINLRDWQSQAVDKCLSWFAKPDASKHFVINAAPGAGKTICAAVIASKLLDFGEINRIIVIAPRTEVVNQWAEEFHTVTGRRMLKITGANTEIDDYGSDLCATWHSVSNLRDGFQQVCRRFKTLIICDEHHHAAVEASWGTGADTSFSDSKYVLVLTGTPMRSDGSETTWLGFDSEGNIDQPEEGMFTLSYGSAVELGYCVPVLFHRHQGQFEIKCEETNHTFTISADQDVEIPEDVKTNALPGMTNTLNFMTQACALRYTDFRKTKPDLNSYQAEMLKCGIDELDQMRQSIPNAGGLVIARNIELAKYMSEILFQIDGERPQLVHSQIPDAEGKIRAFRNSRKKWIVSVGMITEGVDIKRLRVMVYLPNALTELAFRQSVGRVVRTHHEEDKSRAYIVMPALKILDEYASRIEKEMGPNALPSEGENNTKICPMCNNDCSRSDKECESCGHEFPEIKRRFIECPSCEASNPAHLNTCQQCESDLKVKFKITLAEAYSDGGWAHGVQLSQEDIRKGLRLYPHLMKQALESENEMVIKFFSVMVPEAAAKFIEDARQHMH